MRVNGLPSNKAANPETTKKPTKLWPINKPKKYLTPDLNPKAEPTPANDNTPGPGVIINKTEANMNSNKLDLLCFSRQSKVKKKLFDYESL